MSSLFDFDCPRTPDGESTEEPWQQKKKIPPMAPSKPPRISRNSSRSMMKSSSTRSRSAPRRVGGGLDPEEYIAPTITRKSAAPSSGNGVISRPRAFSSSGMTGSDGLPRAPSSGPSRYVPTAPSSGPSVYTASPRVAPKSGAWNYMEGNHPRTNSSDWWKEEIVNETEGKGSVMDMHYGLSPQEKQHFYGKSSTNPFDDENRYFGNPGAREFSTIYHDDVETGTEQGVNARGEAERVLAAVDNRIKNQDNNLHSSLFDQANRMHHSGYYHSDDYSFNQVNLSDVPISPRDFGSPPKTKEKRAQVRNNILPGWVSGFISGRSQNGNMPSYTTSEMNIAPRGSNTGYSSEWFAGSPKVTFDTYFNPNGVRKRGIAGHWERLSPAKRVSVGVITVVLVCTIMGVAVTETMKNYAAGENAALALAITNPPTPSPTFEPTKSPTRMPITDRPTRHPISRSPVAMNGGLHGKSSDGTPRPSRMPITMSPTASPEVKPSNSPSNSPTVPVAQKVQGAPSCTDAAGEFTNHLGNLKTCDWLNYQPGFSDRKNKNCGTQWPDGSTFPVTDLGANCQSACALYNNCGLMNSRTQQFEYERPMAATSAMLCEDQEGLFKNHLDSLKDCTWLDNGKDGHTDRKSKNCGWGPYLITELGWNCPQTCIWYNKIGCWDPNDKTSVAGMSLRVSEERHSSTACMNGSDKYENHVGEEEYCDWLHTDFRLERNCGFERHDITPLGEKCPWSCRDYNACSMPGMRR